MFFVDFSRCFLERMFVVESNVRKYNGYGCINVRATCDNHSNRVELCATTRNTSTRDSSELIRGDKLLRAAVPFVDYCRQASSLWLRETPGYYFGLLSYKEILLKQKSVWPLDLKILKNIWVKF